MIRYLKHKEIDFVKWDQCIEASLSFMPYPLSWYLNCVSPNWDALVLNDYEAVMPLTHRKKFGISYLHQPLMCKQLGVFSSMHAEPFNIDLFIKALPKKFRLIEIALNNQNIINSNKTIKVDQHTNFYLSLNQPYQTIYNGFHRNHKRNILKANDSGMVVKVNSISFTEFYNLKMDSLSKQKINFKNHQKSSYFNIFKHFEDKGEMKIYTAYLNNTIISSACFIFWEKWTALDLFSTDLGKNNSAGYLLFNRFFKDYCERKLILDFMGSNVHGIALHNKGYGAIEDKYPFITINRLPKFLKFFKK